MATSDYAPLLVKGIRKIYDIVGNTYEPMGKKLFHVEQSNARYEQIQRFGGYGLPQVRGEGTPVADGAIFSDFGKTYYHSNYGLKDVLPQEAIDDDIYGMLTRWCTTAGGAMAESYATNDEILAANFLTNIGFGTAPVSGSPDGQPIFSTAHPISRVQSAVTVSNRPSTATEISMAGLQAARANLEQQKKANNLTKIRNRIVRLVFNPNKEEIALQLLKSDWVPDNADRNMNTLQIKNIEPFSWPYWEASGATDSTAFNGWFVQGEDHFLTWFVRQATTFKSQNIVAINSVLFASFQRQSLGHDDWRGLYGDLGN